MSLSKGLTALLSRKGRGETKRMTIPLLRVQPEMDPLTLSPTLAFTYFRYSLEILS